MFNWQHFAICFCAVFVGAVNAQERIELAFGQTGYDFTPILNQFEEDTGIKIITAPQDQYDLKAELIKSSERKNLPDAFIAPADYTTIKTITLQEITEEWLDPNVSSKALQTVTNGDKISAIPLIAGNHLILYFNRGIISEPATSFSELESQLNQIPASTRLMNWVFNSMYWFIPFLDVFDASLVSENKLTLDTPEMAAALTFYWQQADRGLVHPSCSYQCMTQGFHNNEFGYIIDGVWAYSDHQKTLGDNLGIALLPSVSGRPLKPYFSSHALAFPIKDRTPEQRSALLKFALYLQSESAQRLLWQTTNALPSNNLVLESILKNADDNTKALVAQLDYSVPIPNTPHMTVVWEALLKGFNRYGADIMTAEQATELMQHLAERTIENQSL